MTTPASNLTSAGAHGGDGLDVARQLGIDADRLIDLSASLNPFATDLSAFVARAADSLSRYPDPAVATRRFAEVLGVDADRLVLTNGGAEAIALVANHLVDGDVEEPAFSLYRRHLDRADAPGAARWKANPSSPLGIIASDDDTAEVWDEAFWPMTTGTWTRGDDSAWRLGSLTKLWACPGLRLGYALAPDAESASAIIARQPKWSVNGLALELLPQLLDIEDLPQTAANLTAYRSDFASAVSALGYTVVAGDAPWLLLSDSPGLRSTLAGRGVLVRDCQSFGLTDVHRIALPRRDQTDTVLEALRL